MLARTLSQFTPEIRTEYRLEIIVSDGGSTDETVTIGKKLADIVVCHGKGEKQNIAIGRNAGAKAARGNILLFINADTIIEDISSFFHEINRITALETIAGVTCNVNIYKEEEKVADKLFHGLCNWYFRFLNIIAIGMGRGECQIVRRDLFLQIGGYNEKIAAGEDFDLFVRLRRKGKIVFLGDHTVRESPRRYRKYGYLYISLLWFVNALSVLFVRRSVTKEWRPVR